MVSSSDEALLARVRADDPAALAELIERYAPRVMRFGVKMCRDDEDAREVVQDTLLTAARKLREFRGESSIATWLYAIARSFCIKHRTRGAEKHGEHVPLDDVDAPHAEPVATAVRSPEAHAEDAEIAAALERAIRGLDPAHREVLLLRDVEGLTAPEVAEVLGASVEAVKSRLHRARTQVRAAVAPLFGAEPAAAPGSCPDVVEVLSRYAEGDVAADACRAMEAHVAACSRCAARCDSLRSVLTLCRTAPAPSLPEPLARELRARMHEALREMRGG